MNLCFVALLSVFAVIASAAPSTTGKVPRTYIPEEDDINRRKSFLWEDANGKLYVEELEGVPMARADLKDITLYLYTKDNKGADGFDGEEIYPSDFETMIKSKYFKKNRKNVFIVHGWNNYFYSPVNLMITAALLSKYDLNVFVVDWSTPANWNYLSAKGAVPAIGEALGDFINQMMKQYNLKNSDISLVGHSLGAHVAGCAGARMTTKPHYIVGLDPASPLFTISNTENRIDETDADFVQIIHTCGGALGLGFTSSIGHSDYYPNGGGSQPGCGMDLAGTCAHSRAYMYFAESIKSSGFASFSCDSYKEFNNGKCSLSGKSEMGMFAIDNKAAGDYYLNTNDVDLFAMHGRILNKKI